MQTENLKSSYVWRIISCHLTADRASCNRFSAISLHDYLHYCGKSLAHFLMKSISLVWEWKSTTGRFATNRFWPFTWKTSFVGKDKVNKWEFCKLKITTTVVFVIIIQRIFRLKSQRQRTLRLLFEDCRFIYFHSLMKSAFLPSKGLLCLYDKQNNTCLLVDMEFPFPCSTRHLTRSLRSLVSYRVKHSERKSISTRAHVLFSM